MLDHAVRGGATWWMRADLPQWFCATLPWRTMAIDLLKDRGTSLENQRFTWRDVVQLPYSKLDDDAFTRVRVILMNAIEAEAARFTHVSARASRDLAVELARVRRVEQQQRTLVNWLHPADQTALETSLAHEQAAVEVTAAFAEVEQDPRLRGTHQFALLEDLDHVYRYSALLDRIEGKDPNTILQSYTDIVPGRPTALEHRAPEDDLGAAYKRDTCPLSSKLHVLALLAMKQETHEFYMRMGPAYADPLGRQLYAEIAAIEDQHVAYFESVLDPDETLLERWLILQALEVESYHACVEAEKNQRIRAIWERFLDYELGQLRHVALLFESIERRDASEVLGDGLSCPMRFESHREFVRRVLRAEVELTASRELLSPLGAEPSSETRKYREAVNADGSPSEQIAAGYVWAPGSELARARQGGEELPEERPSERGFWGTRRSAG